MSRYFREKGGKKNAKSGTRWSEEELRYVLRLYLHLQEISEDSQPKIHEHNKDIQILGERLGRETRSVESQMLMFRCLDRHGKYSRKNMSRICRKLWEEHLENIIKK